MITKKNSPLLEVIRRNRDIGLTDDPQFSKARRYNDWRNYIPDEIRTLWNELSVETRVISFMMADKQARQEKWMD